MISMQKQEKKTISLNLGVNIQPFFIFWQYSNPLFRYFLLDFPVFNAGRAGGRVAS